MSDYKEVLVKFQLWILWKVGIDAYSAYVLLLKEGKRQEEIRRDVAILKREVQKLEYILQVVQELERNLLHLAASVIQWDAKFCDDGNELHTLIKKLSRHVQVWLSQRYSNST